MSRLRRNIFYMRRGTLYKKKKKKKKNEKGNDK